MNNTDKTEFAKIWATVANLYGKNISAQLLTLTFEVLKPFSLAQIKSGLSIHIRSCKSGAFFPKPADIIQYINGNNEQRAEQAWSEVETAIRRTGAWGAATFNDPLIAKIIERLGGWKQLCHSPQCYLEAKKKAFTQQYSFLSETSYAIENKIIDGLLNNELNDYPAEARQIPVGEQGEQIVQIKRVRH